MLKKKLLERFLSLNKFYYQNLTYNADKISKIVTIKTTEALTILYIAGSLSNAFSFIFGPSKLNATIIIVVNINDKPMAMRNGI